MLEYNIQHQNFDMKYDSIRLADINRRGYLIHTEQNLTFDNKFSA